MYTHCLTKDSPSYLKYLVESFLSDIICVLFFLLHMKAITNIRQHNTSSADPNTDGITIARLVPFGDVD